MQLSSSSSSKSLSSLNAPFDPDRTKNSPVNWISVINFLETEYTKSSTRQKEWLLQKKLLHQEILQLKNQLQAMETLNVNLNNRIKLLENALKRQKLIKNPNNPKLQNDVDQARSLQQIEKYFHKNGWNLSQKPKSMEQNPHQHFLSKVMDEVGIKLDKIEQRCRKMSMASQNQKYLKGDNVERFQNLINDINKVRVTSKIKINAHLDSVRGIFATSNSKQQRLLISVSQDCMVKLWNMGEKNLVRNEPIEPVSCFREHTGSIFTVDGGNLTAGTNDMVFFTGGSDDYAKVWYTESRQTPDSIKCIGLLANDKMQNRQEFQQLENDVIWSLKYKDKRVLTSTSDGVIRLYDFSVEQKEKMFVPCVKLLNRFYEKGYVQTAVEWVGDRGILSGCSTSPKINLWDAETAKIVNKYTYQIEKAQSDKSKMKQGIPPQLFQVNTVKYQSSSKLIYAGCEDKAIRIFSYDQNKMVKRLNTGVKDSISCVDLMKENLIVAGCQDGGLKVWDRRMYKLVIEEVGHRMKYDEGILCVRTIENEIFTGGADGVINVYTI